MMLANCLNDRLVDIPARLGSLLTSVKLSQVAIDSPSMQPCTLCLGTSCNDGVFPLIAPDLYCMLLHSAYCVI